MTNTDWQSRQREVQQAAKDILSGAWTFLNNTVVDQPTHYAVQQYRDQKGLVRTLTFTREGIVLTIV